MKPPKFRIGFNNSIKNGGYDVHTLKTGVKASVTMADGRATGRTAGDICISRAAIPEPAVLDNCVKSLFGPTVAVTGSF